MTEDVRAAAQRMYEAFNARDYGAVAEIFTADFYSHPLETTGPESVAQAWRRFHEAVPDVRVVVEDMVVEEGKAAVRTSVHGIPGQPPPCWRCFGYAMGASPNCGAYPPSGVAFRVRRRRVRAGDSGSRTWPR